MEKSVGGNIEVKNDFLINQYIYKIKIMKKQKVKTEEQQLEEYRVWVEEHRKYFYNSGKIDPTILYKIYEIYNFFYKPALQPSGSCGNCNYNVVMAVRSKFFGS